MTILATQLLLIPTIALYNIQSYNLKVWLIAVFTVIFSSTLTLLTYSGYYEIFTATAA